MAGSDIGYYTLPVILSFKGIDSQVEANLGKSMQDLGKKTGEQLGTAVITGLDPTKSPKVNNAIKSTSGAGKKMGDAITTEVAKNIDGKKITDKMSASVKDAVQGTAGKKMGEAVTTAITKNFDTKGLGTKITDDLAKAQSGEAFKGVGKKIGEHIHTGIKNAKIDQSLKDAIDSPLGRELGTIAGRAIGKAIGDQVSKVPGFDKVADTVEQVSKYAPNAATALGGVRDAINATKGKDYQGALAGVDTALRSAEPIAKKFGIDISSWPETVKTTATDVQNVATAVKAIGSGDVASRIQGVSTGITAINTAASHFGADITGVTQPLQTVVDTAGTVADIASGVGATKDAFVGLKGAAMTLGSAETLASLGSFVAAAGPIAAAAIAIAGAGTALYLLETDPYRAKNEEDAKRLMHPQVPLPPPPPGAYAPPPVPAVTPPMPPSTGPTKTPIKAIPGSPIPPGYQVDREGYLVSSGPETYTGTPDYWSPKGRPVAAGPAVAVPGQIPGAAEATAAAVAATNIHANSASISVGSATISGVSVPSAPYTSTRPGFTTDPFYKKAGGGAIDTVPIMATAGEHMLTTADVAAMGGQQGVYDFRNALHRNGGGPIPPPPPTWGKGVPPPWLRRPGPNRAAIKGVYYGGAIGYDDGGEIKQLGEAIAGPVAKAAAEGAAKGAEAAAHGAGAGMALPAILGGAGGQQMGADIATQLLGIGAGGVGETLGLGTMFPDPMQNPNVRSLMALASAFKGPIMGAMKGKLGIQQPGWKPGMPVDAMAGDTGAGASIGLPFGLPSIDLPNAPEGGGAPPGGGPVGGGDTHVDASLTVHGDVGSDKALRDHQQQIQRGLDRLAPMPTGPN